MMISTNRKALNRFDRWAIRVSDLMRRDPFSIRADATIGEATAALAQKEITSAPVINEAGRPIGVLSLTDLVGAIRDHASEDGAFFDMPVREIMTPFVFVVDVETPVYAAVGELLDYQVRQMYVADKDGTLIGVLSTTELIKDLCRLAEEQDRDTCATAA